MRQILPCILAWAAGAYICQPCCAQSDVWGSCRAGISGENVQKVSHVPHWAQCAIWYQIFVERFRNGDPTNDPTLDDIHGAWPHFRPASWKCTPWTHDWYRQEEWARNSGRGFYETVYLRRYGGDLQGILDKLDYLQQLGVSAIYLNPINDAPSLHKYDARNYHHIDRNFGPDPRGDKRVTASENPADPESWKWTSADRMFLRLIHEVHQRGMRIIVDYSWNHTGTEFWAWKDVARRQETSPFADWYEIKSFDNPATAENEFRYRGWAGIPDLPELKKVVRGGSTSKVDGDLHPQVKRHVLAVTRRWLDPNSDGDSSDGVDGFRLDVDERIPMGFWRDFRKFVRAINPEALLVGEIWWEKWPVRLRDPRPWLAGDAFDAVMHYHWYVPTRGYFANALPRETTSSYAAALKSLRGGIPIEVQRAMVNVAASHDTPRLATSLANPGLYKYRVSARRNADYRIDKPDERIRRIQKMLLVQQFTWIGAPHIWQGDEVGMWGADDPDNRKPMLWRDLQYEVEAAGPDGRPRTPDEVKPDQELLQFYRRLISMRLSHQQLFVLGDIRFRLVDDDRHVLVYERTAGAQQAIVAFNNSDQTRVVRLPALAGHWVRYLKPDEEVRSENGRIQFRIKAKSAAIVLTGA